METHPLPPGYLTALKFPLVHALWGRRSRRFLLGGCIPDGPLAFTSPHEPQPLDELERLLVLCAVAGNTGWHYLHPYNVRYAPQLPNYAVAASGRSFPSAAGFETSELFFTDDSGTYFFATRDAPALVEKKADGLLDATALLEEHRPRIRRLSAQRLHLPPEERHIESHNTWVANRAGSLLVIPVADLAQHHLATLAYYLQNGYALFDDVHGEQVPNLEQFSHLYRRDNLLPLSYIEQASLMEATTELATSCYAGALMLQAMGLGGWMFDGINPLSLLGASGDPAVPGLGFHYDSDGRWPVPNPTGLTGVFEAYCPPHYSTMCDAVEALAQRKFGRGGPFHPETPGPWRDSGRVRGQAAGHSDAFKACVALQAQYTLERFGKFPGTVPSVLTFMYLQAHHLELAFYEQHFGPGAYLETHARHMERWHLAGR